MASPVFFLSSMYSSSLTTARVMPLIGASRLSCYFRSLVSALRCSKTDYWMSSQTRALCCSCITSSRARWAQVGLEAKLFSASSLLWNKDLIWVSNFTGTDCLCLLVKLCRISRSPSGKSRPFLTCSISLLRLLSVSKIVLCTFESDDVDKMVLSTQ